MFTLRGLLNIDQLKKGSVVKLDWVMTIGRNLRQALSVSLLSGLFFAPQRHKEHKGREISSLCLLTLWVKEILPSPS